MFKWFRRALLLVLVLAAVVAGTGLLRYQQFLATPLTVAEPLRFEVPPGSSLSGLARRLEQEGALREPFWLRLHGRLSGKASRINAGEYELSPGMTPGALLDRLVAGDVVQHGLTIVEGWTFAQMLAAVHGHEALVPTLRGVEAPQVMAKLGAPERHPEGWFYPDTYHFPRGTTDLEFLRRAYELMQRRLDEEWAGREPGLPLKSPYEALILASIVERETAVAEERARIAGVFVRRLRKGMRLQTDPTVIYGMGDAYQGDIRFRDLRRDTPYNTYTRSGLTPTPIAMPSGESIHAALHPAPGNELYFVARGDGSHHFSATLAEHNAAVRRYQLKKR